MELSFLTVNTEAFAGWALFGIIALLIWELVFKGIGMWHAAQNRQQGWFISILILNTAGLLPIIYLLFFQKKQSPAPVRAVSKVTKQPRKKVAAKKTVASAKKATSKSRR